MQEQILNPSGMPNSTFMVPDIPKNKLAWPHLRSPEMRVNPIYPYHRGRCPGQLPAHDGPGYVSLGHHLPESGKLSRAEYSILLRL